MDEYEFGKYTQNTCWVNAWWTN